MKQALTIDPAASALELSGLSFCYAGQDVPTFEGLDLVLEPGSFTLLTGTTGCGKTTLLRCCKPELAPAGTLQGGLSVFGHDVATLSVADSAHLVGYVSQSPENQAICNEVWHELAFGLENLGTSPEVMRRRVAEVAHFFGIGSWLHQEVATLSGGQKQLLNLASVLALQPKLLLLDEPTAQLDPVAERTFLHALFRINREANITILVATHSLEVMAPYATGRIHFDGTLHAVEPTWCEPLEARPTFTSRNPLSLLEHDPVVAARDLHFRYARTTDPVLRGCSIEIQPGSLHAIVGGNASGKSTLLRLIAGIRTPQRGRVTNQAQRSQGFVPQDPKALFVCDSVIEELREWQGICHYGDDAIDELLSLTKLDQRRDHHPYDLSGGQQQLLALAKVLLTKPRLLLLDEPTKGLDTHFKLIVAQLLLDQARQGATIIMSTHDLAFVDCLADFVTMLFDGQDACTQPTSWFFQENLFYRPTTDAFHRLWKA